MSTTSAAPALVARANSKSRRSQSYSTAPATPHRAASASSRPPPPGPTPLQRSGSQSQSHSYQRPASSHQSPPHTLGDVLPRRDFEASNLPEMVNSRRSTSSRDGSYAPQPMSRPEPTRTSHRSSSRSGHARQGSDMTAPPSAMTNGEATPVRAHGTELGDRTISSSGSSNRRRTTITAQSGQWALGKTIGAGSMGKVKLAKNLETGEQVAVKIVPRHTPDDGRDDRDRERHDRSKEIRTQREAAIVSLLDHPYICGLRDVVKTNFHWYMLFEFVDGGQMLDYIISHGRLKEKPARKFSRQIASALDYCHRNSIVHRDLKIENILISKTGDIKIIDFGLSNLFSPRSHLKTFCGSLYFAAPELLQAKPYTGPEVDVWSFGIVLYVLVCGKVPFDDQSMPQLHAKIKKGIVDYPQWLSAECKNLISRMLVTDPRARASLQEIMAHPWMCKGFNAPVENYLPPREPLQLPLDPEVIDGMTGFDFGPPDFITGQLVRVLESEDYQNAVRAAGRDHLTHSQGPERRRFAAFDFYKRRSSTTSGDNLANPSAEAVHLGADSMSAYSPLISIYNLVREKQRRQRAEINPGATSMPRTPHEQPLKVPDLPAPVEAHTNSATPEMPGEPATGGRARPRARTHGEDDVTEAMKKVSLAPAAAAQPPTIVTPPVEAPPPKKESTAVGLLRRLSTRRHRDPEKDNPAKSPGPAPSPPTPGEAAGPTRKSFSVRRVRNREGPPISMLRTGGSQPHHQDLLSPPATADPRPRRGGGLGRSTSVNSADLRRRSGHHGAPPTVPGIPFNEPPLTSGSDRSSMDGRRFDGSEPAAHTGDAVRPSTRSSGSTTTRARSLGHARRESIQARRARREEAKEADVPEETDQELAASGGSGELAARPNGAENVRPVFLKGLFSVSTTSPKPVGAIRIEIIRVLRQLGVDFTEIRGGFRCRHRPSIDLHRGQDRDVAEGKAERGHAPGVSNPGGGGGRRRLSFGGFIGGGGGGGGGGNTADRDEFRESHRPPNTPRTPSRRHWQDASPTFSEGSEMSVGRPAPAVGETSTHVQSELGDNNLVLSFEIIIVKVPILALHGLQFKRMAGGTWQYKNMADKILKELRL